MKMQLRPKHLGKKCTFFYLLGAIVMCGGHVKSNCFDWLPMTYFFLISHILSTHPSQKKRKNPRPLGCMLNYDIGCMNIWFLKPFVNNLEGFICVSFLTLLVKWINHLLNGKPAIQFQTFALKTLESQQYQ
jgi:hypothetical protein